ncbi:MAG: response regulator [Anaerolineales bacterium]|jgi:DNA-binding response OmpR family regulator
MSRILVVDDEPDTLKLISLTLERAGYEVIECLSGEEALRKVPEEDPDMIVLDVMLPDLDGFEVARRLLAQHTPAPPILFFTARGSPEDQQTGRALGWGYLVKPVRLSTLLDNIRRTLGATA